MIDPKDFQARKAQLLKLFQQRLSVQSDELAPAFAKAGRRLPRGARKAGASLIASEGLLGNPRLAVQLDAQGIERAFARVTRALEAIDPRDRRIGIALNVLGSVAFNLLVFLALCLLVARWRGWI